MKLVPNFWDDPVFKNFQGEFRLTILKVVCLLTLFRELLKSKDNHGLFIGSQESIRLHLKVNAFKFKGLRPLRLSTFCAIGHAAQTLPLGTFLPVGNELEYMIT